MRLLVTGASGFVGSALVEHAVRNSWQVVTAVRRPSAEYSGTAHQVLVGDLAPDTDWSEALQGVDAVVHAAARVHVMRDTVVDPLEEFRRVNVAGTMALARQAASAGVRRFVYLSSIKVNGEESAPGRPFQSDDVPRPVDPYGISKLEAEQALGQLASHTGLEVVVVRPTMVYGPGVKANFRALLRSVQRGLPLPLGNIHNKRSFTALDNLVSLILVCVTHPAAANQTFLAADGEDLSTTELLERIGVAMNKPARLIPVPAGVLRAVATAFGKRQVAQRLCCSLQADISRTRACLQWAPVISVDQALRNTTEHFVRHS